MKILALPNGLKTNRPIVGADWSLKDGVDLYDSRTGENASYATFEDAAPRYKGCLLVLEATAESFQLQRREVVLKAFKDNDIQAYCFNSRYTSKFRINLNIPKSNKNDAKAIYRIAAETQLALHRFKALRDEDLLRGEIQGSLIEDRLLNGENSQEVSKRYLDEKEIPAEYDYLMIEKLKGRKGAKKREYRVQAGRILMVAEVVHKAGRGYREFRRQLGNYAQGLGSMARSEYYWHWGRNLLNREIKAAKVTKAYKEGDRLDPRTGKPMKIRIWSDAEKELRDNVRHTTQKAAQWLWRQVKV